MHTHDTTNERARRVVLYGVVVVLTAWITYTIAAWLTGTAANVITGV
jgi:uncharacterized membrane protein